MNSEMNNFWYWARQRWSRLIGVSTPPETALVAQTMLSVEYDENDPATRAYVATWKPYEPITDLTNEDSHAALTQSGLSYGRDSDIAFVRRAIAKGSELRKTGTPLDGQRLKHLGYRRNVIITTEFLDILTEKGCAEPRRASQCIMSAYQSKIACLNRIGRMRHAGISEVRVLPNNMAAGPCPACLSLSERDMPIEQAPSGPLPGCPHPDQCFILFRSVIRTGETNDD